MRNSPWTRLHKRRTPRHPLRFRDRSGMVRPHIDWPPSHKRRGHQPAGTPRAVSSKRKNPFGVGIAWRSLYWSYLQVRLAAAVLVWRFIRPDRPPQPVHLPIDWLAVTAFVAWIVAIVFAFSWYRKWGGWSSNEFVATIVLCVALPVALVAWLGSGFSLDEHANRIL